MLNEKVPVIITRGCFIVSLILFIICGVLRSLGFIIIADVFLNLGITLMSGSLLGMTWEIAIGKKSVLEFLEFLCPLVRDFQKSGIERFYQTRRNVFTGDWERWAKLIENAKQIDIMGNNLRQNWCNEDFLHILEKKLKEKKCTFRFLLFDPNATVTSQRQNDEDGKLLKSLIEDTLAKFKNIKKCLNDESKKFLLIKLVNNANIYCYIVRIDDRIVATNYYRHVRGGGAFAMEIYGDNSFLFKFFAMNLIKCGR